MSRWSPARAAEIVDASAPSLQPVYTMACAAARRHAGLRPVEDAFTLETSPPATTCDARVNSWTGTSGRRRCPRRGCRQAHQKLRAELHTEERPRNLGVVVDHDIPREEARAELGVRPDLAGRVGVEERVPVRPVRERRRLREEHVQRVGPRGVRGRGAHEVEVRAERARVRRGPGDVGDDGDEDEGEGVAADARGLRA